MYQCACCLCNDFPYAHNPTRSAEQVRSISASCTQVLARCSAACSLAQALPLQLKGENHLATDFKHSKTSSYNTLRPSPSTQAHAHDLTRQNKGLAYSCGGELSLT